MDNIEFKRLLFKVAFCSMACDGHVDDREVNEMRAMDRNTPYFDAIDLSNELSELVEELHSKGVKLIDLEEGEKVLALARLAEGENGNGEDEEEGLVNSSAEGEGEPEDESGETPPDDSQTEGSE